jgi:hypothetical protein
MTVTKASAFQLFTLPIETKMSFVGVGESGAGGDGGGTSARFVSALGGAAAASTGDSFTQTERSRIAILKREVDGQRNLMRSTQKDCWLNRRPLVNAVSFHGGSRFSEDWSNNSSVKELGHFFIGRRIAPHYQINLNCRQNKTLADLSRIEKIMNKFVSVTIGCARPHSPEILVSCHANLRGHLEIRSTKRLMGTLIR